MDYAKLVQQVLSSGYHQDELAAKLGVHPGSISRWVNGQSKPQSRYAVVLKSMIEYREEKALTTEELVQMLNDRGYKVTLTR